jgi:hypothetical protein
LVTVALICEVPVAPTGFVTAETETKMGGTSRITWFAIAGLATEVAVTVTCRSLGGGVAGAV